MQKQKKAWRCLRREKQKKQKHEALEVNATTAESFQKSMETESGGLECLSWRVFLDRDEAEEGWRSGQCSQAGQAVITVLQVLIALVAARVSWGVSQEATPVHQQLLLRAFRLTASLWVAASCNAQRRHQGHDSHSKENCGKTIAVTSRSEKWSALYMHSFRWPAGGNYSDSVRRKNAPQPLYFVTSKQFPDVMISVASFKPCMN